MAPRSVSVVTLKESDLQWGFDDNPPYWLSVSKIGAHPHRETVDPTRCYMHGLELVKSEAQRVAGLFPIGVPTTYHISRWESLGRSNGWFTPSSNYSNKKWEATIALGGKRIPPMPTMTRYLVAHEYGHAVDEWLCKARELESSGLDEEYRVLRKMKKPVRKSYGPGNWHLMIGEVFANDFRIVVCGSEPEFWPHPCSHPSTDAAVKRWWKKALKDAA